jgi:5,10-methylenetetrahydromethanopterin reductase
MRISMNIGGDAIAAPVSPQAIVEEAKQAEAEGFPSAWTVHFTRGVDAISTLSVAGTVTSRIELGIGIVPTYPRHPMVMAQEAASVQTFCGGRFTLGVGVSHKPVISGLLGLPYASPAKHMREYLSILGPLLRCEPITFAGEFYRVNQASFNIPGYDPADPPSVVVGALGPKMVEVAGELSDGTITWLANPRALETAIVPGLTKAAEGAGRKAPRVIAGIPVVVCDDAAAGRAAVESVFARYGGLENYQKVFALGGVTGVGEIAIVGTEKQVEADLRRLADAGATELWPAVFAVGPEGDSAAVAASIARTRACLAALGPEF